MADIFIISSESEINKASSLANRASRAYYKLKDRNTPYARSLFACYIMMARIMNVIIDTQEDYRRGRIVDDVVIENNLPRPLNFPNIGE